MPIKLSFRNSIEFPWSNLKAVRIGCVPDSIPTPDKFVLIESDDIPILRVDIYLCMDDDNFYIKGCVLDRNIFLCFGNRLYCLSSVGKILNSIILKEGFVSIKPFDNSIFITTSRCLFKLESDGTIIWKSDDLGLDGVEIIAIKDREATVDALIDPTEKRMRYVVSIDSGKILSKKD